MHNVTLRSYIFPMNAPEPLDEAERLKALRAYHILDTEREQGYDDLTALAASVTGAPMAVVSLVDADRQWFKSCVGVDTRETSREISFCAHAILTPAKPLVVNDAWEDPRFAQNANVLGEPMIRFYAGIPLVTNAGQALGTLCVLDRKPRQLTTEQLALLTCPGAASHAITRTAPGQRDARAGVGRSENPRGFVANLLPVQSHQNRTRRVDAAGRLRDGANGGELHPRLLPGLREQTLSWLGSERTRWPAPEIASSERALLFRGAAIRP